MHFLVEHFGLKDDDFARLTAELTPDIQGPARLWITIYASWLYRMTVRAKYGDAVFDIAFAATKRRLEKKVEGYDGASFHRALEFWFDKLDSATTSLGAKFQDVEIPFEAFAAWTFLALDPDSPYQGKSELPNLLDLTVADCLEKAKAAVMPLIEFSVEIGGPLPEDKKEAQVVAANLAEFAKTEVEGEHRFLYEIATVRRYWILEAAVDQLFAVGLRQRVPDLRAELDERVTIPLNLFS